MRKPIQRRVLDFLAVHFVSDELGFRRVPFYVRHRVAETIPTTTPLRITVFAEANDG